MPICLLATSVDALHAISLRDRIRPAFHNRFGLFQSDSFSDETAIFLPKLINCFTKLIHSPVLLTDSSSLTSQSDYPGNKHYYYLLGICKFIPGKNTRNSLGKQQQKHCISHLVLPKLQHSFLSGQPFCATRSSYNYNPVHLIVFSIRLIMLAIIGHKIFQCKSSVSCNTIINAFPNPIVFLSDTSTSVTTPSSPFKNDASHSEILLHVLNPDSLKELDLLK